MKRTRMFPLLLSTIIAFALVFVAYLYWTGDESLEDFSGNYRDQFAAMSIEEVLEHIPGSLPILQYHMIMTPRNAIILEPFLKKHRGASRYVVTTEEFRREITILYNKGFRPISLDEYLSLGSGAASSLKRLAPDTKPFVLTFDDATYGQVDFVDTNSDGILELDPDCALGVLIDFHRQHPDFALTGAFCIEFSKPPFFQPSYVEKKLNLLLDYGFEIVNHTKNHRSLSKLWAHSPEKVNEEIGGAMEKFKSYLGYRAKSINKIAYPNGHVLPKLKDAVKEIHYNGKTYRFVAALHAFGLQAPHPRSARFDPYLIPRIEMSSNNFEKFVLLAPRLLTLPPLLSTEQHD